ncbi:MAG: alpha/beta hydrolase family protein [Gemmatimonadota bacterium]
MDGSAVRRGSVLRTGWCRNAVRSALVLLGSTVAVVPAVVPAAAQADGSGQPGSSAAALDDEAYAAVVGLYEFDDGARVVIFDMVDQLREHQLVALEPGTGRARTLYPASDTVFEAGSAWFVAEPREYRLRFGRGDGGVIERVVRESPVEAEADRAEASAGGGSADRPASPAADRAADSPERSTGRRVPLREREVEFDGDGVRLSGSVILPEGEGPHPGVVIVHGSGPLTRRGPRYMGQLFADRGVAALVYDKRGTGGSTGEWQGASHEALTGDARAAVEALRRQPEVDAGRVGLYGSSEGGYVVPVVASADPEVAFLVCRVCPALTQRRVAPHQQADALRNNGFDEGEIDDAIAFHRRFLDYAVDGAGRDALEAAFERWRDEPWMERYGFRRVPPPDAPYWSVIRGVMTVDPSEHYARLSIPVLVVLGERDGRIPVDEHRAAFAAARDAAGNDDFSIEVMSDATHGLLVMRTGPDGETLPFDGFAPEFHDLVVDWVAERAVRP